MPRFILPTILLLLACSSLPAAEKKRFALYATMLQTTPVALAGGPKWVMVKGDTFPLLMFKEQQTKVVLQLADTNFWVDADAVRIAEEKDITEEQMETYRANVKTYLDGKAEAARPKLPNDPKIPAFR